MVGLKRGAVSAGRPPSVTTAALKRTCATVWHFGLDNCWAVGFAACETALCSHSWRGTEFHQRLFSDSFLLVVF